MDCSPPGSSVHGNSPGKNTGVGCHALLQEIFPTQGLNPGLPHRRQIFYHLSYQTKYLPFISLWNESTYLFNPGHDQSNDLTLFIIFWHLVEGWEIAGLWKEMKFWSLLILDINKDREIQTVRTIWVQAIGQFLCYMQSSHSLLCHLHRE